MVNKNIQVLNKIIDHAKSVLEYTRNITYDEFLKDKKTVEASIFNISQIGELAKLIDKKIIDKYNNIDWYAIKSLRNKIVYDYDGIQLIIIWRIIQSNLPQLIKDINKIIEDEK